MDHDVRYLFRYLLLDLMFFVKRIAEDDKRIEIEYTLTLSTNTRV